jgi:hypothetical protein
MLVQMQLVGPNRRFGPVPEIATALAISPLEVRMRAEVLERRIDRMLSSTPRGCVYCERPDLYPDTPAQCPACSRRVGGDYIGEMREAAWRDGGLRYSSGGYVTGVR